MSEEPEEARDYSEFIPDAWDTAYARQYHYGAAAAATQPEAPFVEEPDAWRQWSAAEQQFTGVQAEHDFNAREAAQKTIEYDKPPIRDGTKPETLARPFCKHLNLWLTVTRQPKKTIGLLLLAYSRGRIW